MIISVTTSTLYLVMFISHSSLGYDREAEKEAQEFLRKYEDEATRLNNKQVHAMWNYTTNITAHNREKYTKANLELENYEAETNKIISRLLGNDLHPDTSRKLSKIGSVSLDGKKTARLTRTLEEMETIYSNATVCPEGNSSKCLHLEPGLTEIMASSRNYSQLRYIWEEWRTKVGRKLRPLFREYVKLKNELAVANGYNDYGDRLKMHYESSTFEEEVLELYEEVKPLYKLLHAYVRRKLYEVYGPEVIDLQGSLPACVLGDMWGRFWINLNSIVRPFPSEPDVDVTSEMRRQKYNVSYMFHLGDDFFNSMGLKPVPKTFYELSMLERPADGRQVECHATAWDFYDGEDFRIRMCTEINFDGLETIHHELGHIQYFMQYAHQPIMYRDGANDGFHEAIGELIAMSMTTPDHLHKIGLLSEFPDNNKTALNYLMRTALKTVSTLPFHLVNDLWRWKVYRGDIPESRWNEQYWSLKEKYLGVKAPVERSEKDLDITTIFHVANDYDMTRYFTRTLLQFQFAEAICKEAGHIGPLHTCDFYGSYKAGEKLGKMLSLGASRPWQDALEIMTGERKMSAVPLLKYFELLEEYLRQETKSTKDIVGWGYSGNQSDNCQICKSLILLMMLSTFLR